jgi:hypothetical protein
METCFSYNKQTASKIVLRLPREKTFCKKCFLTKRKTREKAAEKALVAVASEVIPRARAALLLPPQLLETKMALAMEIAPDIHTTTHIT